MRRIFTAALAALALSACGEVPAGSGNGAAAPEAAAQTNEVSDADRAAIVRALQLSADAQGQVENECGEPVTPQFLAADVGAGVGRAVLVVMSGGPNSITCYGDGPGLSLLRNDSGAWRLIYSHRGGPMLILPSQHNEANELASGGPGLAFPVWRWNGTDYEFAGRDVGDAEIADARILP